jgi:hypothetical protein
VKKRKIRRLLLWPISWLVLKVLDFYIRLGESRWDELSEEEKWEVQMWIEKRERLAKVM